ncbi:Gag-Pol polyprotein, partial [Mucuna pruriens]
MQHHGVLISTITLSHLCILLEHPKPLRKDWKAMQSTTYRMIRTYGDCVMIKSHAGVFRSSRSSRSSTSITQQLEEAIMDPVGQPEKYLIAGYTDPPYSKMCTNSSRSVNIVDYISKWVEVRATKTNDARVVVDFLKSHIFCKFGVSKVLISDQGSHFCNHAMVTLLEKYGVVHRVAIAYHPQTNDQAEVFNKDIKKLLQNMANLSQNDWRRLLEDAL